MNCALVKFAAICILLWAATGAVFSQTTVTTLEDPKGMGYPDARKIVRDSSGNLYAAYRKRNATAYQIYVSKFAAGDSMWRVTNSGQPISTISGACNQRVPAMAIDGANVLHVVWYGLDSNCVSSDSSERQIKYSRSTDGGATWATWRNIAPVSGYSPTYEFNGTTYDQEYWQEHPVVYIIGDNKIYVVWEGRDAVNQRPGLAKFIKSSDGGATFSAWKNVNDNGVSQSRPTIVVDGSGKIYVFAYSRLPGASRINVVYSTSVNDGATFTAWTNVALSSSFEQRHASAAIDAANNVHLVWRQEDAATNGKTVVKYSKFNSSAWTTPATIAGAANYYQFFPSIAELNGTQYVVWTETLDESGYVSETGSEDPTTGKIVLAKRTANNWERTDLTEYGNNTWASLRWSSHRLNGGKIDVVYSTGATNPYLVKHQSIAFAPKTVTGRVFAGTKPIPRAQLTLIDQATNEKFYARSNDFGYFRFKNVVVGQTLTLQTRAKNYSFEPQIIIVSENATEFDVFAQQ